MRMNTKETVVPGFVLKSMVYKENDAIIYVLTRDYGKLSLLARGVQKIKSKNAAGCQPLTESEFRCILRPGISTLLQAVPTCLYRHIKEDIIQEAYASYFMECMYKCVADNEPNAYIYDFFMRSMQELEAGKSPELLYCLFNAFILKITGSSPQVDGCIHCGNVHAISGVSIADGGFVCQNCQASYDKSFSKSILQAFRYINKGDFSILDKIHITPDELLEIVTIMESLVDEYTGIRLHSRQFIKQLERMEE